MFEYWPRSLCRIFNGEKKVDAADSTTGNSAKKALWYVRAWRLIKTVLKNRKNKIITKSISEDYEKENMG